MLRERGNILFLILLAVVLFAALAYAVTSSMRGGGTNAGTETTQALMSELLNYYAELNGAVQRMMLIDDVKDYQLSFRMTDRDYITGASGNPNCTSNKCRIFHPEGGGISGKNIAKFRENKVDTYSQRVFYYSVPGAGTEKPDIVLITYGASYELCRALNAKAGLADFPYGVSFTQADSTTFQYYYEPVALGPIADTTATLTNLPVAAGNAGTFCFCRKANWAACQADSWEPMLVHVVVAR